MSDDAKIEVTFKMSFATDGKCKTDVLFSFQDHPGIDVGPKLQKMILEEIHMLTAATAIACDAFIEDDAN